MESVEHPEINIVELFGPTAVVVQQPQDRLVQRHGRRYVYTESGLLERLKLGRYPVIGARDPKRSTLCARTDFIALTEH